MWNKRFVIIRNCKRLLHFPIGGVNIISLCVVFAVDVILGVDTILATYGMRIIIQIVCLFLRFETLDIEHQNI